MLLNGVNKKISDDDLLNSKQVEVQGLRPIPGISYEVQTALSGGWLLTSKLRRHKIPAIPSACNARCTHKARGAAPKVQTPGYALPSSEPVKRATDAEGVIYTIQISS
jgi:hypothetical protein